MNNERTIPKQSLARIFPGGFAEFWARQEMKSRLESVVYDYVPATLTVPESKKTLMSGYGMNAVFIAKHYFLKYQYRVFEPYEDDFMAQFTAELTFVIAEIRRTEWLWQDVFRNIKQWLKPLKVGSDTRTSQNYDKTQAQGGKTITSGNESSNWQDQKQSNQKNIPAFANVDLTSGQFGGFSRQQQLSTQSQEQGQGSRSANRQNTTTKQNHSNKEFYRAAKDSNVSITKTEVYELNSVSRLLNNFHLAIVDFSKYYARFNRLFIKMFGVSVVPIWDPETGRRRYVSEAQYEEMTSEETATTRPPEGNEWDESLPYLERLKIILHKTEKEYKKLPDTSNRKPRVALRLKVLEGCLKAYEPEFITLPSVAEFQARIRGEVEGYTRVIGYANIIQIVERWLRSYHFASRNDTPAPAQLMIMLLGEPGLGKTYISMAIAKALGRGFHMVGMNGKKVASLITGTGIDNPGAEPGEVAKAISRREDRGCVICFDEIEKADRECKEACGIPTDITTNRGYTDIFVDFPIPTNECIFVATVNRPQDVPQFVADRFAVRVEVLPLGYLERLEVVRVVLQGELKKLNNAFRRIYHLDWERIYERFNQEELLKRMLTWTFSIRGAKNNVLLKLIPVLISDFLEPELVLPTDLVNYDWDFLKREGKDESCPYVQDRRNEHKRNCMCFVRNLNLAPGWEEEMGTEYRET